jgi:hypothetical protein
LTTTNTTRLTPEQQAAVIYWPEVAGIPFIEADTRKKHVNVKGWQNIDFSKVDFRTRLAKGAYDNGIALVLGKTLSGQYYSFALDFDGIDAVLEWFGSWKRVTELSKKTRIEWHGNKWRLHCILLAKRPIVNRKIHIKNSLLEIRCESQLLFSSPSINQGGNHYTPLGTDEIAILDEKQLLKLAAHIETISQGYMSDTNKQDYIRWLEDPNTKLVEGEGRHPALVILGTSYFYRYTGEWKDMTDDQRRQELWEWNLRACVPPKPEKEFNSIWKWIVDTHRKNRDELHEKMEDESRRKQNSYNMPGCVSYQINANPDRFVAGTPDNKLVEIERKYYVNYRSNPPTTTEKLVHNKTFTACKPVRLIKHRNPLSFLEMLQKYTIEFSGSEPSGNFTIRHKTLSEIVGELKNGNALHEYGLDIAITAQIKGFEKAGLLEINDDIDYTGFFPGEGNKHIISSGITQIGEREENNNDLSDALTYINELAGYFESRLDLLSHCILFGVIAPFSFIFKVIKAPILEWLDLHRKHWRYL